MSGVDLPVEIEREIAKNTCRRYSQGSNGVPFLDFPVAVSRNPVVGPYPWGVPRGWPLTGRAEELSRISELTRRRDGPAGVVLARAAGWARPDWPGRRCPRRSSVAR
jgi:hypothetical protein